MSMSATTYVGPYLRIQLPKRGLTHLELNRNRLCDLVTVDPGVLTPNSKLVGRRYDRDDAEAIAEISQEEIEAEMSAFQMAFARDIETLKQYSPRVCWGVVRYWL